MSEGNNEFRRRPLEFDAMVDFHEKWILAEALKITRDLNEAEIVRGNTFLRAYLHWARFSSKGHIASERGWLKQRLGWARSDWLRWRQREQARPVDSLDSVSNGENNQSLEASHSYQEWAEDYGTRDVLAMLELFRVLLEKHPEKYKLTRDELRWYYEYHCQHWNYPEIAAKYAIPELTVREGIKRVEAKIRELYCSPDDFSVAPQFLDSLFDAVLEDMKDHPPLKTDLPNSGPFTIRAIRVFAVYLSPGDDKMTIGNANRLVTERHGRGPNLDGTQLQRLRACFCISFEAITENRQCVDALEISFAESGGNIEMLSKREKLLLAGRGYDMPSQRFPADFDFLPRRNP